MSWYFLNIYMIDVRSSMIDDQWSIIDDRASIIDDRSSTIDHRLSMIGDFWFRWDTRRCHEIQGGSPRELASLGLHIGAQASLGVSWTPTGLGDPNDRQLAPPHPTSPMNFLAPFLALLLSYADLLRTTSYR